MFFYNLTVSIGLPNFGLAIILFTIVLKIVLYPLTVKQMRSMKMMSQVQPFAKEIQQKYKDNPQKMQQKLMELYKEHNINPMAGCLPLLIQLPILFALFAALKGFNYDQLLSPNHASFFWIQHLNNPDPIILPLVVALTTYLQTKVSTPGAPDQTQKTMMYVMPIFIGWITRSFPAGLALYWSVFNIMGIIQQIYINKQPVTVKGELASNEKR